MRIQTEYIGFKIHWIISSSEDFKTHQQHSKRWCFSLTTLQWFEMLTGSLPALWGLSSVLQGLSLVLRGSLPWRPGLSSPLQLISTPITSTPVLLLYHWSDIQITLKGDRNALLGSDALLTWTLLSLHSSSSLTLLVAPRNYNTFYWLTSNIFDLLAGIRR